MDRFWYRLGIYFRRSGRPCQAIAASNPRRRLKVEPLETRRMPAVMTVTDLADNTLANLAGDGQLSLREAVEAINTGADVDGFGPTSGMYGTADQILFAGSLFSAGPRVLFLVGGQLELSREVTLTGPGQTLLTLDAQQNSRVLQISHETGDFTLAGLTLSGGLTNGSNGENSTTYSGGAIRSLTSGSLTIDRSTLSGNGTTGDFAYGGGLFALGSVSLTSSTVSGNQTMGYTADGGGVYAYGSLTLTGSTISGNSTSGSFSNGGGIYAFGGVTLTHSTISGNTTSGSQALGAGIYTPSDVTLNQSTVTDNHALDASATAGGIWNDTAPLAITGSIVADNTAAGGNPDLQPGAGALTVRYSLIGDNEGTSLVEAQLPDANGNLIGSQTGAGAIDPLLSVLLDHGGPTLTHALLSGSPALNAGDPTFDPQAFVPPLDYDQRGPPYGRVTFGQIDMGAVELDADSEIVSADFDADTDVDGSDFLAWQRGAGLSSGAVLADGDATGDGAVRGGDLAAWQSKFGEAGPAAMAGTLSSHEWQAAANGLAALGSVDSYVLELQSTESMPWRDPELIAYWQRYVLETPASRRVVTKVANDVLAIRAARQRGAALRQAPLSAGQLEQGLNDDEREGPWKIGHMAIDRAFARFGTD